MYRCWYGLPFVFLFYSLLLVCYAHVLLCTDADKFCLMCAVQVYIHTCTIIIHTQLAHLYIYQLGPGDVTVHVHNYFASDKINLSQ